MLHRGAVSEQRTTQRIRERLHAPLHEARMAQRVASCHDVNHDDAGEPGETDGQAERAARVMDVAQHDQPHLVDHAVCDHHREVHDEESEIRAETEEVNAACGLPPGEKPDVPRRARRDRRRHGEAGEILDLQTDRIAKRA